MKRTIFLATIVFVALFAQTIASAGDYESYYPSQTGWSTIAFEDNWPNMGDYDMNDLVLRYRVHTHGYTTEANNLTTYYAENVEVYVRVQARGADFRSGFGMQMSYASPSNVYVTGGLKATLTETLGTSATVVSTRDMTPETGQTYLTWILFPDVTSVASNNPGFKYYNTESTATRVVGNQFKLQFSFITPVDQATLLAPPYNPFIFRVGNRPLEVHLAGFQPTDKANISYFGEGNDGSSNVKNAQGKYEPTYVTKASTGVPAGLPWALNFGERWNHPLEKQSISSVYFRILNWIADPSTYTDWYIRLHTVPVIEPYMYDSSLEYIYE